MKFDLPKEKCLAICDMEGPDDVVGAGSLAAVSGSPPAEYPFEEWWKIHGIPDNRAYDLCAKAWSAGAEESLGPLWSEETDSLLKVYGMKAGESLQSFLHRITTQAGNPQISGGTSAASQIH